MKPHFLGAYVKPHTDKRKDYIHIENREDKPPVTSYVVCVGKEIVFESKSRGECNRYILANLGREYEVKAVRG